jgi:hypothetical protein
VGRKVTASPVLSNVRWSLVTQAAASGGSYSVADLKGQSTKLAFRGTGFTLTTARGPAFGKASVAIDGKVIKTVDLWSSSATWGYTVSVGGLTDGVHTVVVKVLGSKNKKSTGTGVVVDGFGVN